MRWFDKTVLKRMPIMNKPLNPLPFGGTRRIFVAGHRGMVGAALVRALSAQSGIELVLRSHDELDLCDAQAVADFFSSTSIDTVYLAAARVGGIDANSRYPAQFITQNLQIETNVIHQAWRHGIQQLLFLGSSCIYPRLATQPMSEEQLLSGPLEPTNEPYAVAKIAGIKLCESYNRQYGTDYRSIMPTNLYGPGDNYHAQNSHVLPALIRRFFEAVQSRAPEVVIWGTGTPLREFLYVDDMAAACLHLMQQPHAVLLQTCSPQCSHLNAGSGDEISVATLAQLVGESMGFEGRIVFDRSKPDGTPRKLLDSSKLRGLGWQPRVGLAEGIQRTVSHYLAAQTNDYAGLVYHAAQGALHASAPLRN